MRAFHARTQHFMVPYHFQIPGTDATQPSSSNGNADDPLASQPWPAELRGMRLGTAIRKFVRANNTAGDRQKRADELERVRRELAAVDFPHVTDWKQFQWEQVSVAALRTFRDLEGHLLVPRKFAVPYGDDRWPRAAWGFLLGNHVNSLRSTRDKLLPYQLDDLEALGFVWNVVEYKWTSLFLPSLRLYRQLYDHVNIPQAFVIPSGSNDDDDDEPNPWPKRLHGFRLGAMINHIRSSTGYQTLVDQYRDELAQLGFSFSANDTTWNEKILPSLATFRDVFGHCSVDVYFVVPHAKSWPEKAWGMRLGFIAQNIRGRGDYVDQVIRDSATLEQLGFTWNVTEAKWRCVILPSLTAFVEAFGHTDVPREFVVPAMKPWPEQAWEFRLGAFVSSPIQRLRFADYIEIDNARLEALGFDSWASRSTDAQIARGGGVDGEDDSGTDSDSDSDSDGDSDGDDAS